MTLYCDLDGVLADLEGGYKRAFGIETNKTLDNIDWALVNTVPNFFESIPLMKDAPSLWSSIAPHRPVILTGAPKELFEEASANKREWVRRHIGDHVEVRCCRSSEKSKHCKPGDVLIDDWEKYRDRWVKAGGLWVTHVDASKTIFVLRAMGVIQ